MDSYAGPGEMTIVGMKGFSGGQHVHGGVYLSRVIKNGDDPRVVRLLVPMLNSDIFAVALKWVGQDNTTT